MRDWESGCGVYFPRFQCESQTEWKSSRVSDISIATIKLSFCHTQASSAPLHQFISFPAGMDPTSVSVFAECTCSPRVGEKDSPMPL